MVFLSFGSVMLLLEVKVGKFDFVSFFGFVKRGKLFFNFEIIVFLILLIILKFYLGRSGSLEIVREEEEEDGWMVV